MILLAGIPSEAPCRLIIEAAEAAGTSMVLLNQREAAASSITLEIVEGRVSGILRLRETDWRLDDFSGIFVRLMDPRDLPEVRHGRGRTDPEVLDRVDAFHEALQEWLELAPIRVMNRPSRMVSNISKPYQAQLIQRVGLLTPPTLVTSDVDELRDFRRIHGKVIFKSISSVRSVVRRLEGPSVGRLDRLRHLPTQFQALIPGTDIRVHVAGDELFATEIRSEAVDYRYAGRDDLGVEMLAITLPAEVEERCRKLSRSLDLPLAGIDLRVTPEGEYYCFEVNPQPGYSYYQQETGQGIAEAIVRYLSADG
ncbi:MAG: hypothetical protein K8J08_20715 [Thermoanaerobaculia bacterium]|nr:hypothetical protein [Thermoanaerobaculia bacterium]